MLAACSSLYRELIKAGISPLEADEMELWQIACLMGPEDEALSHARSLPGSAPTPPPPPNDALLRERVRRARAGEAPISEDELEAYDESSVRGISSMLAARG